MENYAQCVDEDDRFVLDQLDEDIIQEYMTHAAEIEPRKQIHGNPFSISSFFYRPRSRGPSPLLRLVNKEFSFN
jgi:hypothetical protein